ncbi:YadA-like family protein [Bartonella refiksaydamii]|uniref:YadA-like family protein n=1 Tax=Bartonella refiksaydamii TaxID=2654951 RepID=UPI0018DD0784
MIDDAKKYTDDKVSSTINVESLRYNDRLGKLSLSFGTGTWRSQSAFAIGACYTSEDGFVRFNLSVISARGHWGLSAGVNFTLN